MILKIIMQILIDEPFNNIAEYQKYLLENAEIYAVINFDEPAYVQQFNVDKWNRKRFR